jgi:hypothetical protein
MNIYFASQVTISSSVLYTTTTSSHTESCITTMAGKRKSNDEPPRLPVKRNPRSSRNEDEEPLMEAEGGEDQQTNSTDETRDENRTRGSDDALGENEKKEAEVKARLKERSDNLQRAQKEAHTENFYDKLQEITDIKSAPKRSQDKRRLRQLFKEVNGATQLKPKVREEKAMQRKIAEAIYEDSLYYQIPERRATFEEHIDVLGTKPEDGKKIFKPNRAPMLWNRYDEMKQPVEEVIESYVLGKVGVTENIDHRNVGPDDLHRRVPPSRRTHVGLGRKIPGEKTDPLQLNLDHEAIEERMVVEEDENRNRDNTVITHSERRAAETQLLENLPTNLYVNDIVPTARDLSNTRQTNGLFLAAGERSSDWLDSYDQMDIVKPGFIAVEDNKIRSINEGDDVSTISEQTGDRSEDNQQPEEGVKGLLNEFCVGKREHKQYRHLYTTTWAETTYGRREREHAHMILQPSSPVESPPHSPISHKKIPADLQRASSDFLKYEQKFRDQYGIKYPQWPQFSALRKSSGGGGYKVAYGPLDIDALPKNLRPGAFEIKSLLGQDNRFVLPAPDGTSMRLLREALNEPCSPPRSESTPVEDEKSDDEGDLFRISYVEGSRIEDGGDGYGGGGGAQ